MRSCFLKNKFRFQMLFCFKARARLRETDFRAERLYCNYHELTKVEQSICPFPAVLLLTDLGLDSKRSQTMPNHLKRSIFVVTIDKWSETKHVNHAGLGVIIIMVELTQFLVVTANSKFYCSEYICVRAQMTLINENIM